MLLGKSSRVISLPKNWLKMVNLDYGDRVSLNIQKDSSLVVHPVAYHDEEKKEIHLTVSADESRESIIRRIIGSYLNGFTLIKLTSEKIFTIEQQKSIRKIVGTLYMMIMESEASSILLQTLINETQVSLTSSIERMHMINCSMCRDILISMKNWDTELAKSVISLEDDVDQLMFFLLRLIRCAAISPSFANKLDLDALECLDSQTLVHRIERIADHNNIIANSIIALAENKIKVPNIIMDELIKSAQIAFDSYDTAVTSYFSKDIEPTNEIIDNQNKIKKIFLKITPLPSFETLKETSMLSHIINIRDSISRISHYAADIAELTINKAYKL